MRDYRAYLTLTRSHGGVWLYAVVLESLRCRSRRDLVKDLIAQDAHKIADAINNGETTPFDDKILDILLEWET